MLTQWSEEEFREASVAAVEHFIENRLAEPTRKYEELLAESIQKVTELFDLSGDLRALDGHLFSSNPSLVDPVRFIAGPPISQDDLKTLTGIKPPRSTIPKDDGDKIAQVILRAIDQMRFPWVGAGRPAEGSERQTAIKWTAGVWAIELIRTWRRGDASKSQETAIAELLESVGYEHIIIESPRNIGPGDFDRFPRGTYTGEIKLDGRKCDVPVRLKDGRIMAIECKVSNSEVNSIKRLVREVGGKADAWRNSFGAGIVTVAVLSGVFGLTTLLEAQRSHGVYIIWEHDLAPLRGHLTAK
jgi:hypothetical protein